MAYTVSRSLVLAFLLLHLAFLVQGQGVGRFITASCTSDAGCDSGCCGFNSGKCAGPVIAQTRDGGCGFGDAQPNDRAAVAFRQSEAAAAPSAATPSPAPAKPDAGPKAPAQRFITASCTSDAGCDSGCCGFNSGKCAGAIIAQTRDGGCGFGDAQPNDDAARALRGNRRRAVQYWA